MKLILASLCLLSLTLASPRKPVTIEPKNPNDPLSLPDSVSKSVLIIGGGISGMSAAMELADRGYDVTIREASDVLGGRVEGRLTKVSYPKYPLKEGDQFNVEHGFHAFFHNYYTLRNIRDRLNINGNFAEWNEVEYIFRDYKPESISSVGPYPLNILRLMAKSPNLGLTTAIKSTLALPDLIWFDYNTIYKQYDNITFYEWANQKHVDKAFFDIIMQPSMSVTVNDPAVISAATMLTFMQLYFLSDPDADKREVLTKPFNLGLINPWAEYLESKGVTIKLNSPVYGLIFEDGKAVSAKDDPHSIFDYVVMAADIPGVRRVLSSSKSDASTADAVETLENRSHKMGVAPPYKVMRVWFNGRLDDSRPNILETPQHPPLNLIARFDLLEDEYKDLAREKNVTVIEFHMYAIRSEWVWITDPKELWGLVSPTAYEIYPELQDMETVGFTLGCFENFPSYAKNLEGLRPESGIAYDLGIKNMFFAGDWLKTKYPSALMEKAVVTGREAANHILLLDNVRQVPIKVANAHGPGLI